MLDLQRLHGVCVCNGTHLRFCCPVAASASVFVRFCDSQMHCRLARGYSVVHLFHQRPPQAGRVLASRMQGGSESAEKGCERLPSPNQSQSVPCVRVSVPRLYL